MKPVNVSKNFWEMPELTHINRLPAHSCLIPHANGEDALRGNREKSPFFLSLDGTWDFKLYRKPDEVPAEGPEEWDSIRVPANWTTEGFWDKPIYTNVQMPWENNYPLVPEENPTGVYRRSFTMPPEWGDRRTIIHLGGVESYFEIYVNGTFAGMGKDCRLPSEYDITSLVKEGKNELTVKVLRWSDGSYIEDQDHWWMAGIYRSVYLYSTDHAYLEDIFASADYDLITKEGVLKVDTKVNFSRNTGEDTSHGKTQSTGPVDDYLLTMCLYDGEELIFTRSGTVDREYRSSRYHIVWEDRLAGMKPWSSEKPNLYTLVFEMADSEGVTVDTRSFRTGFRNVTVRDRELLLNGQPVMIKGVNRHEHDELTGKTVSRETMLADIRLLKQFNFNAVRTCHYPDDMLWYDLCDEYGIYLIDEANIEAHANYTTICRDPRWKEAFEERILNMVKRDKNHPCIFSWSLGNETGNGENHSRVSDRVRAYDPSRLIHHEGEVKQFWTQGGVPNNYAGGCNRDNDMINPMYPTIAEIIDHAVNSEDPRPVILCEYSHAMGNSNGNLKEYWEAFYQYKGLQGGFIWDWVDQGLKLTDDKGVDYWGYGGDFGEKIHDFDFCINGMIWPDRTPHPSMYEFKKLTQPVVMEALSTTEGRFTLTNRQYFSNLDDLALSWKIEVQGELFAQGSAELPQAAPFCTVPLTLAYELPIPEKGQEAFITFSFTLKKETPWAPAGHEVAWEQFALTGLPSREAAPAEDCQSALELTADRAVLSGGSWRIEGDTQKGEIISWTKKGREIFSRFPELNIWRALTDNDEIRGWSGQDDKPGFLWKKLALNNLTLADSRLTGDGEERVIRLKRTYHGIDKSQPIIHEMTIGLTTEGSVKIDSRFEVSPGLPDIPRLGLVMHTAQGFEELEWFGKGPWENYIDRNCAPVGLYRGTVSEQFVPYILPQENGNKTDVRRMTLSDGRESFSFRGMFEFSAGHFTAQELEGSFHTNEPKPLKETVLTVDLKQKGLGTKSCGHDTLDKYRIYPGTYDFSLILE
ncbi:MAG: DUF4981 domain-containing protein [Spirochaetales bacterium]|nr:DUF4981 domain-containing protein [Spirochaetales bacterium]